MENFVLYKNVLVNNCNIGENVSIGDDSVVINSSIEQYVEIDRRNYIHNSVIGSCTYTGMNIYIGMSNIGKFCSILEVLILGEQIITIRL